MKRYGNLWDKLISWDNLVLAAHKAHKGKRSKRCVQQFEFNLEAELLCLQYELMEGTYTPGEFRTHWIVRPKPRKISAAPYRDRVVHHALMNVLEPILDGHFHPHSFACRKGKGTHAAADRLQMLMKSNKYALQGDIRKFFPSIDHEILKSKFRRLIKDGRVLDLMDLVVDQSNQQENVEFYFAGDNLFTLFERRKGLPIGNLTSQWFANWYLNDLDHYVTKTLGCGNYVRYCDDFIVLDSDRNRLVEVRENVKATLAKDRLMLHANKLFIKPVSAGITFVGFRSWPHFRLVRKDNIRNFNKKINWMKKAYASEIVSFDDVKASINSWMAHVSHANSRKLVQRVSKNWTFTRAAADQQPRNPRRQLEQQRQQLPVCESQQEQPEQYEQQYRISGLPSPGFPALSDIIAWNHYVYGYSECGIESPGCCPELAKCKLCGRILTRSDRAGKFFTEGSIWLHKTKSNAAKYLYEV